MLYISKDSHEPRPNGRKRYYPGWCFRGYDDVRITTIPLYIEEDGKRVNCFDFSCNWRIVERKSESDGVNCFKDDLFSKLLFNVKTAVNLYGPNYRLVYETTPERMIHSWYSTRPNPRVILGRIEELRSITPVVFAGTREKAERYAYDFFNSASESDKDTWKNLVRMRCCSSSK